MASSDSDPVVSKTLIYDAPMSPPVEWTPPSMIQFVQTAMRIELSTIPLYLYAMYSIEPDNGGMGSRARAAIRGVVEQEMLHLSLAGNILAALDGSLDLYNDQIIPKFPDTLLYDNIPMVLERAVKTNLENFLRIEAPYTPRPRPTNDEPGLIGEGVHQTGVFGNIAPGYHSIGAFYNDLQNGIKQLQDSDLSHNPDKQFSGADFFGSEMVLIRDIRTALDATTLIVDQGEGDVAIPDGHYSTFVELYQKRESWTCRKVPANPKSQDYVGDTLTLQLSLTFDAAYCYLLQTIQRVWTVGKDNFVLRILLLRNVHSIMANIISPVAGYLVKQPYKGGVAGPCFGYYPPYAEGQTPVVYAPQKLYESLILEAKKAEAAATGDLKLALTNLVVQIQASPPS